MSESRIRDIDRLAARSLLVKLHIDPTPSVIEVAANELAAHRERSAGWIVDRVRSRAGRVLEDRAMHCLGRHSEDWASGVWFAQEQIATMSIGELLDQPEGHAQSRGQVLRSMVRKARDESAIVVRQGQQR